MKLFDSLYSMILPSPIISVKVIDVVNPSPIKTLPPAPVLVDMTDLRFIECGKSWSYLKEKYPFTEQDISTEIDFKLAIEWREALADDCLSVIGHVWSWPTRGANYSFDYVNLGLFDNDLDAYFENFIGDRDVSAYSHTHILHVMNEPYEISYSTATFDILSREDFIASKFKKKLDIIDPKPEGATHAKGGTQLTR